MDSWSEAGVPLFFTHWQSLLSNFLSCHPALHALTEFKQLFWYSGFSTLTLPSTSTLNSSHTAAPLWEARSPGSGHLGFAWLGGSFSQERESLRQTMTAPNTPWGPRCKGRPGESGTRCSPGARPSAASGPFLPRRARFPHWAGKRGQGPLTGCNHRPHPVPPGPPPLSHFARGEE